ncbi:MAG: FAD-dependent monooxygenase [Alphaproteobacteria bacterium]|nr:FAD-dependent monooxygenase [Alphaproteobacteria bacterium]
MTPTKGHAIVLGGSISGLLAARVLTDHFDRVTIVEKDKLANDLEPRKSAPQGAHAHALLSRGRTIVEGLFPGISDELVKGGATLAGIQDVRVYILGWRISFEDSDRVLAMTRPFFESTLARRTSALNKVSVLEETEVAEITGTPDRATGITVRDANGTRDLAADFIIDARGRASNLADWMKQMGLEGPPHVTSPLASCYSSCLYEPEPGAPRPRLHQVAKFEDKLGVLIFPVEKNRVLVSLGANAIMPMPKTQEAFLAYLHALPVPDAYDAVKPLRALTPIAHSRFSASVRRDYHMLKRLPEGIVAIGDAIASFNPVFGQGMTVAALEVEWLAKCLAKTDPRANGFAKSYYAGVKPIVDLAWGLPDLEARRNNPKAQNWLIRFLLWYTERMQKTATRSVYVARTLLRVQNMVEPPAKLFGPPVFFRVLFA